MKAAIVGGIPSIGILRTYLIPGSSSPKPISVSDSARSPSALFVAEEHDRAIYQFDMCLWLLTACLGLLPSNPSPAIVVVPGVPTPILQPTTVAATTATSRPPMPGNMTMPSPTQAPTMATPGPTMGPPTMASPMSPAPTMASPMSPAPTMAPPMTPAPTMAPPMTPAPTMAPPMTPAPTMAPPMTPVPTITTTIGGVLLPLILCKDAQIVCIFNPDEYLIPITGPLPIDPRLGTTPPSSAALQGPPLMGYSAQIPSYDTAVKFPRQKRNAKAFLNIKAFYYSAEVMDNRHEIRKRQSCRCVPMGTCIRAGPNAGAGMIDIRIVTPGATQCPAGQEYCCGETTTPQVACGTLQTVPTPIITPAVGQAKFGEFPWQAIILTKQNDYIAGGVLIDSLNILTVTHRLLPYIVSGTAPNVKVRLGEWDAAGTYEPVPYQEYTIKRVSSHPSYNANTLQFDITVLRLANAVPFTPNAGAATTINRACLPPAANSSYNGLRCVVSGWGKNLFGVQGQYQQIMKRVEVPIVAPATCQTQLQAARLGPTYTLDTTSFVCAGGEANKDACTGDGGSGLVCQANGQWVVVGLVAWGLGCANANVSAVYVNVAAFLPWIQQQVAVA